MVLRLVGIPTELLGNFRKLPFGKASSMYIFSKVGKCSVEWFSGRYKDYVGVSSDVNILPSFN